MIPSQLTGLKKVVAKVQSFLILTQTSF